MVFKGISQPVFYWVTKPLFSRIEPLRGKAVVTRKGTKMKKRKSGSEGEREEKELVSSLPDYASGR